MYLGRYAGGRAGVVKVSGLDSAFEDFVGMIGIMPGFVMFRFGDYITYTLGHFGTTYHPRADN